MTIDYSRLGDPDRLPGPPMQDADLALLRNFVLTLFVPYPMHHIANWWLSYLRFFLRKSVTSMKVSEKVPAPVFNPLFWKSFFLAGLSF